MSINILNYAFSHPARIGWNLTHILRAHCASLPGQGVFYALISAYKRALEECFRVRFIIRSNGYPLLRIWEGGSGAYRRGLSKEKLTILTIFFKQAFLDLLNLNVIQSGKNWTLLSYVTFYIQGINFRFFMSVSQLILRQNVNTPLYTKIGVNLMKKNQRNCKNVQEITITNCSLILVNYVTCMRGDMGTLYAPKFGKFDMFVFAKY